MKDFITQVEKFLFDIVGIIVPGLIFSIFLGWIFKEYFLGDNYDKLVLLYNTHTITFTCIVLIVLYIFGTLVKVLAITQYILFSSIFTPFQKLSNNLKKKLKDINMQNYHNWGRCVWLSNIIKCILEIILKTIINILEVIEKAFTFYPPKYGNTFEDLKDICEKELQDLLGLEKKMEWYTIYKISTVAIREKNITSLAERFLAKYNFFRSMAFICMLIALYFSFFMTFQEYKAIIIISWGFWYSFHYKFNRYWTLCGDEALVAMVYHLKGK